MEILVSNIIPQAIDFGSFEKGTKLTVRNKLNSSKLYIIDNGKYGVASFTLTPGGEFSFTIGDKAPKISIYDTENLEPPNHTTSELH